MWPARDTHGPQAAMMRASAAPSALPPELAVDLIGNPTVARGAWGFWLRLVMPMPRAGGWREASQRERARRARLLSIFLLGGFLITLALVPESFFPSLDLTQLVVVGSAFVLLVASACLNRLGRLEGAGTLLVLGIMGAVAANQLTYPGGLPLSGRTAFDLFVIPILLAGVLLPRAMAFASWGLCSAFVFLDLQLGPKQPDLAAFIKLDGIYTVAATPILLLGAVALVAWVAAGSVHQAIQEADRTRELERAYQFITQQKRQLEDAVAAIQQVHAQAAQGDLSVRAPIGSHALAPLAVSLNLMLERLAQARGAEVAMGGLEQRLQVLEQAASILAQAGLRQPIPQHDMGRLTPLAQRLEQLRVGILSAFQHAAEIADRAGQAFGEYAALTRQARLSESPLPTTQELADLRRAEQQVTHALTLCQQYPRRLLE